MSFGPSRSAPPKMDPRSAREVLFEIVTVEVTYGDERQKVRKLFQNHQIPLVPKDDKARLRHCADAVNKLEDEKYKLESTHSHALSFLSFACACVL